MARAGLVVLGLVLWAGSVFGQPVIVTTPPRPLGLMEFVREVGVGRWEVRLNGKPAVVQLGSGCPTTIDDVGIGYTNMLYEDMTFQTGRGNQCGVRIERMGQ